MFVPCDRFAEMHFELRGKPFSLENRPHLRPIYRSFENPQIEKIVMKFGRQTEKCVSPDTMVVTDVGLPVSIRRYDQEGDILVNSWDPDHLSVSKSRRYRFHNNGHGRVYQIKTESGRELTCSASHLLLCKVDGKPMWVPAVASMGLSVAEPLRSWKFLESNEVFYKFPTPLIFGANEKWSMEIAGAIGFEGAVDLKSERDAKFYQQFLSKLGFHANRHGRSIDVLPIPQVKEPAIRWSEITEVKKSSYSEWLDIEILNGPPSYCAEGMIVHNTTTIASVILAVAAMRDHTPILCVNPTDMQVEHFSKEKLEPFMSSYNYRHDYAGVTSEQAVKTKKLNNGSRIWMRASYRHADRSRGISSDILVIDEIQDILRQNIQIIEETQSHADFKKRIYAGTPKSFDNPLESEWSRSSKSEWTIKCEGCNKYNSLGEANIGTRGLICDRCGKSVYTENGMWLSLNPSSKIQGFRFPAIAAPWVKWDDILYKMDTYTKQAFYNEVLALSCDLGLLAIPSSYIISSCDPNMTANWERIPDKYKNYEFYMGVDWGTREYGSTVVAVIMKDRRQYRVVYTRAYRGMDADPDFIMDELVRLFHTFKVRLMGLDWGGQLMENERLRKTLSYDKIAEFYYSGNLRKVAKYEPESHRIVIHRERVLAELFNEIRDNMYVFPAWESDFQILLRHFMNMVVEYSERSRMARYIKKSGERDDFVHALNYARCAARVLKEEWPPI